MKLSGTKIEIAADDREITRSTEAFDERHQPFGLTAAVRRVALACGTPQTVEMHDGHVPLSNPIEHPHPLGEAGSTVAGPALVVGEGTEDELAETADDRVPTVDEGCQAEVLPVRDQAAVLVDDADRTGVGRVERSLVTWEQTCHVGEEVRTLRQLTFIIAERRPPARSTVCG